MRLNSGGGDIVFMLTAIEVEKQSKEEGGEERKLRSCARVEALIVFSLERTLVAELPS